ncbi:MAG: penicillin-binding transpeptidase domain-containing protein [Chitinophagaceae bacterium]
MRYLIYIFTFFSMALLGCSPNNVTQDKSLQKFFGERDLIGCFGLYDNGQGNFMIYNLARYRDSAYLPASTFKIVNSLIGIQTGKVMDSSTVIPWDGIVRNIKEWNRNLTMKQAFNASAVPWYQELARRIGKDTMQKWLDSLGYAAVTDKGRAVISQIDTFWLDNSIRITADEQLGLVKRLYFDQLPFFTRTQQIVKRMMLQEENPLYRLSYKTGWGHSANGHSLGWVTGWIEENKHLYFFVLQVESADPAYDVPAAQIPILKKILSHYGFMEGKK